MKLALLIFLVGLGLVTLTVEVRLAAALFFAAGLVWFLMPAED